MVFAQRLDLKLVQRGITILLIIWFTLAWGPSQTVKADSNLPSAGFEIDGTRSDPDREVRDFLNKYTSPLIDTHAHLDPPSKGGASRKALKEIVETINRAGVDSIVIMPVPNEGHMRKSYSGAKYRKMLQQTGGDKIKLFCGSAYISNWLHDAYRSGYSDRELNKVLEELSQDLADPACRGIGEIGLYHFNKTGNQNIIEYPPNFEPFLRIVGKVAEKGAWLDLHAEPVRPSGKSYEAQVFGGLELLFQRYPGIKLILSHSAMTNPTNVRRILTAYPNVMMNFKPIKKHHLWKNLEPITDSKGRLYSDWAALFEEMPQRFMVGTDEKFGRIGKGVLAGRGEKLAKYEKKIKHMRKILGLLNPAAAEMIAYKNAEKIY
jgi:hypothetical protein